MFLRKWKLLVQSLNKILKFWCFQKRLKMFLWTRGNEFCDYQFLSKTTYCNKRGPPRCLGCLYSSWNFQPFRFTHSRQKISQRCCASCYRLKLTGHKFSVFRIWKGATKINCTLIVNFFRCWNFAKTNLLIEICRALA